MGVIDIITETIIEYAGPLGKFVVIKVIKDKKYDPDNMSREEVIDLINTVVNYAIFDPDRRADVKKALKKRVLT